MIISKNSEVVDNWLNYIDFEMINDNSELGFNKKTFVLDSIEVLDFIRKNTDNIPRSYDNRLQFLLDLCQLPSKNDYYQRFLRYDSKYYHDKNHWWIDCWQSIRLNT